jgi:hypothetical protein
MNRFTCTLLLGAVLLTIPSTLYAACTTADLEGKWRYVATWFQVRCGIDHTCPEDIPITLDPGPHSIDCHFRISSNGTITIIDTCNGTDQADIFEDSLNGWQPALSATCKFTGCLSETGNNPIHCHRGQMSPDKTVVNGSIRSAGHDFGTERGSFSLVRR